MDEDEIAGWGLLKVALASGSRVWAEAGLAGVDLEATSNLGLEGFVRRWSLLIGCGVKLRA